MELITIKTFDNAIELHIVKARMEAEGITCFVFDENIVTVVPLFTNAVGGGIKLKVREDQFDRALTILKEIL